MVKAFYHEQSVKVDGETLRLAINFKAIDATEQIFGGRGYDKILDELQDEDCPQGTTGRVVWGLLREHHQELDIDQAASLLFGDNGIIVGAAVSKLLSAAFPDDEKKKAKGPNPPKPRGRSKPSTGGGAKRGLTR